MALGAEDLTAAGDSLKVIYSDEELELKIAKDHPFFAAIKKSNSFEGKSYDHTVQHGFNQSAGPTIAVAESTVSTAADAAFSVTQKQYYGYGKIDRQVILASRSKKGSFVRKLKQAMDNAVDSLTLFLMHCLWGNGGGAYGRLDGVGAASGLLNTQVRLANPHLANWIEKDMQLQFSVNTGFGGVTTVKQAGGGAEASAATGITLTVLAVNRRSGVITFTAAVPIAAGEVAVNDYIFRRQTKGLCMSGVRAWNPMNDIDAALALFGATRSDDIERLSGLRYLDVGGTYAQTILEACSYAKNLGAMLRCCYMNPIAITKLGEVERSKTRREEVGDLGIGFDAVEFATPVGKIDVFSESAIPPGWAYITNPDDWEMIYLGDQNKPVEFFEEDGLLSRVPGADQYDFRIGGYGNFIHHRPVNGLWVKLEASAVEI
jgi:hypothetical protein